MAVDTIAVTDAVGACDLSTGLTGALVAFLRVSLADRKTFICSHFHAAGVAGAGHLEVCSTGTSVHARVIGLGECLPTFVGHATVLAHAADAIV